MDLGKLGGIGDKAKIVTALPGMWQDIKDKDWHCFYERIGQARDNGEADSGQLDKLEQAGHSAEANGESFPGSIGEMTSVISKHMGK